MGVRGEATVQDRIFGLCFLILNYDRLKQYSVEYPTYVYLGPCRFWFDFQHSVDEEIEQLWASL